MKNILIPSGVAYFPGSYMDLLHIISSMYGTLDDENTFHCKVSFPRRNYEEISFGLMRGRISYLFRCSIERHDDSCKIFYRVYPTFVTVLCLLLVAYIVFSGLLYSDPQERIVNFIGTAFIGCVFFALAILARRSCIRQFVRKFEGGDESNFH